MKEELIEKIKKQISFCPNESTFINPNYLNYFDEDELLDILKRLEEQKCNISKISNNYLDEIYEKTKKDEL